MSFTVAQFFHFPGDGENHPFADIDHPVGSPFQVMSYPQQISGLVDSLRIRKRKLNFLNNRLEKY